MLERYYAEALLNATGEKKAENLLAVLRRKGHIKLLPAILSAYKELARNKEVVGHTTIRVAQKSDAEKFKSNIEDYEQKLDFHAVDAHIVEDASIVGGFTIERRGKEVDQSYRKRLVTLYRKIISAEV